MKYQNAISTGFIDTLKVIKSLNIGLPGFCQVFFTFTIKKNSIRMKELLMGLSIFIKGCFLFLITCDVCLAYQTQPFQRPPIQQPIYMPVESPEDRKITESLREAIQDDYQLSPYNQQLFIQTQNGVVKLYGAIDSHRIRLSLEQRARRIPGVKRVEDHLQVNTTSRF